MVTVTEASSKSTRTRDSLLLALSFAAGYVDALSYLGLSRVLTANMTGNTVLLAIDLAQLDAAAAHRMRFRVQAPLRRPSNRSALCSSAGRHFARRVLDQTRAALAAGMNKWRKPERQR